MSVSADEREQPPSDAQLAAVANQILARIADIDRSNVRVSTDHTDSLVTFSARASTGIHIMFGGGFFPFVHQYTKAAATFFLADPPGDGPSRQFLSACAALATSVDWVAVSATTRRFPAVVLTPRQIEKAREFAELVYSFVLCHEIAHVALGHFNDDRPVVEGESTSAMRLSQDRELAADQLALRLQAAWLPPHGLDSALASAVYFIHALGLLDYRLMLLAELVDEREWAIRYSHPPTLHRVFNLMGAAQGLAPHGAARLQQIHHALAEIDGHLVTTANAAVDDVRATIETMVDHEARRTEIDRAFTECLERSPCGVLKALEPGSSTGLTANARERLAQRLPTELQQFRKQSRADRARRG